MLRKTTLSLLTFLIFYFSSYSQVVVTYIAGQDNCNRPPEGGSYAVNGTLNGKNRYSKDAYHFIEWDGSQWIFRSQPSYSSSAPFVIIYTNAANTSTPPCTGWFSPSGCFVPSFSGACSSILPTFTSQPAAVTKCSGGTATFTVAGSNINTYRWQVNTGSGFVNLSNNTMYSGTATTTLTITGVTPAMNGYLYQCVGTGASSNTTSSSAALTVTTITTTGTQVNIACNGGATGIASVIPSGGTSPYTYAWSPSGGVAGTANGLIAATYTVNVTDANGCTLTKNFTITQPTALTATASQNNVSCNGGSNGSATVLPSGGTGTYTYSWTPSGGTGATASGLATGNYTVAVTDANGCTLTKNYTITQPTALTATASQINVSCNGGSNGSATVLPSGGTGTYTYSWAPSGGTGATASGLATGNYTVTITDANGCTLTQNYTITQPTALTATASQNNVSCNGGSNGSATVLPSGGTGTYTYSWAPSGGTGAAASGLTTGNYTVTITDANGCTLTKNFTVTQPTALTATASQINVSCNGGSNGSATVLPSGGTGTYTYSWAPSGGTGAAASGLTTGNYTVTITDANGCTLTKNFTVTQPTALTATASQINISCNGGSNGSATILPSGGTGSYTFSWAPTGGTAATASGLATGTYSVTITDANGCTLTKSLTLTEPNSLVATTSHTNVSCNGGSNGSATVLPTGGTGSYNYSWAPTGGTAATASGLTEGTYTVLVTDVNECSATNTITITEPSVITINGSQTNVSCKEAVNGSAIAEVTGGTGSYTFSWSPNSGTASAITGLGAGDYTVVVTDVNECTQTHLYHIVSKDILPEVSLDPIISPLCLNTAPVNLSGLPAGGTYSGSGVKDGIFDPEKAGVGVHTIIYSFSDKDGCSNSAEQQFTVSDLPEVTFSLNGNTNACLSTTQIALPAGTPSGGAYTGDGVKQASFSPSEAGLGSHTIVYQYTDKNGCSGTAQDAILVDVCTGIANATAIQNAIYPNPNNGNFTLELLEDGNVTIYNTTGQPVFTETMTSGKQTINLENKSKGIYLIRIQQGNSVQKLNFTNF